MSDSEKKPWQKQEYDTKDSYEAFQIYLANPDYSLRDVTEERYGKKGVSTHVERWSRNHNWVERREKYLAHLADKRFEAREQAIIEAEQALTENLKALMDKAIEQALKGDKALLKDLLDRAGMDKIQKHSHEVNVSVEDLLDDMYGNN